MLARLGNDHNHPARDRGAQGADRGAAGRAGAVADLGSGLRAQSSELSDHKQFSVDTGVSAFFCDPRSPWQRGSNENTNGLLRRFLPKGTDLAVHDQAQLDRIAAELNGRPRQTLGWANPAEKMLELLTAAA